MTREQILGEPVVWLQTLLRVASEERATQALLNLHATLGAVAPGSLKNGDRILKRTEERLARSAGLR